MTTSIDDGQKETFLEKVCWQPMRHDVTRILNQIDSGDPTAASELLPLLYDELRKLASAKLASETPGQTMQATALVHEAYLRLIGPGEENANRQWNSRGHFYAAAAEAMRRILVENARRKGRIKRGGDQRRITLESIEAPLDAPSDDLLALNDALEQFAIEFPKSAELVKLRFFGGLSLGEAAVSLGIARRSADREWAFARAWLFERLSGSKSAPQD